MIRFARISPLVRGPKLVLPILHLINYDLI
jgi:hypothetical protein